MQQQQHHHQRRSLSPLLSLLLLLFVAFSSAELSPRGSRLAENLGILLGLPLDEHTPAPNTTTVPDFILDVYNCWTALRGSSNRASCLPMSDVQSPKDLNDVNVVRGIKSTDIQTVSDGYYSHSSTPLPSSLSLNFNVSLRRVKEDIRFVYVRVEKQALTATQQTHARDACGSSGPITLQLLVNLNSSETDTHRRFTLLTDTRLRLEDLGEEMQVEFSPITNDFIQWSKEDSEGTAVREMVEIRVIVGTDCGSLGPEDLGFTSKSSAFVIVFSKSDDSEEAIIKAGLAELAAEATTTRQTRNVGGADSEDSSSNTVGSADNGNATNTNSSIHAFDIDRYTLYSCRRYSHTISFAELGWSQHIFQPERYEANFCAGSCDYPLNGDYNTTKHSYIQSLAAKLNPELVPPPCCAPHELRPVTVIYMQSEERFVTHEWQNMRAESCGCK